MKHFSQSSVASLGFVLLALGSSPSSLPGQTAAPQSASPQAPVATPNTDQNCNYLESATEQLSRSVRNTLQEGKLAELSQQLAKEEAVMSSPEMAKLRNLSAQLKGQLEEKRGDLESGAEEMAAHAQELAALAQDDAQNQAKLFVSSDDGGGWLGVEIGEVTAEKAKDLRLSALRGVIVQDVEPDSPAAKAGLKENDVILRYDDQNVEGTVQFRRLVRETPAGRTIPLEISRSGQTQNVSVELANRSAYYEKKLRGKMDDFGKPFVFATPSFDVNVNPEIFMMDAHTPILGINAEDLTGQLGSYFGAPKGNGILIREVRSDTAADKAGLKAGDVIIKVDDKPVASLSELREQLRDKSDAKSVNLTVLRKGSEMTLPVAVEKPKPVERTQTIHRAQL
jgi:serine protease Do